MKLEDGVNTEIGRIASFEYGFGLTGLQRELGVVPVYGSRGIIGCHSKAVVQGPGIVVGRKGTVGHVTWASSDFWPIDTTYYVVPKLELDLKWLYHSLTYANLAKLNAATGVPGLNRNDAYRTSVWLPPPIEQHHIAGILDAADRTIIQTERMIEKLRATRSGLLHDLLTRGIGNEGEIRQKPAIESATAGWRSCKLGELLRIRHGYAFKGEYFDTNGPYIVLTPGNFYETGGFRNKGDEEKYYTGQFPMEYILSKDDLIVAMTEQTEGLLGASAIVPESGKYLHNQRLGLIIGLDEARLTRGFLFTLFNSRPVRSQIQKTAAGTKVRHTSPDRIYQVEIAVPPPSEQLKIVSVISLVDRCIELEELYREKATSIKEGLMADLLSGRVRIKASSQEGG